MRARVRWRLPAPRAGTSGHLVARRLCRGRGLDSAGDAPVGISLEDIFLQLTREEAGGAGGGSRCVTCGSLPAANSGYTSSRPWPTPWPRWSLLILGGIFSVNIYFGLQTGQISPDGRMVIGPLVTILLFATPALTMRPWPMSSAWGRSSCS